MRSVKPGRGPSFMNGVMSVVAVVFGIFSDMDSAKRAERAFWDCPVHIVCETMSRQPFEAH